MAKKKNTRGKVIDNVGHFRICQKHTNSTDPTTKKSRTVSTDISIYHAKTLVKSGFKNKETAVAEATKLLTNTK